MGCAAQFTWIGLGLESLELGLEKTELGGSYRLSWKEIGSLD